MVRCKKCARTRCNGGAKGGNWKKWQLCSLCAVIEHPEDYKPNYILMTLAKHGHYKSKKHARKHIVGGADNNAKSKGKVDKFGKRIVKQNG